MTFPRERPTAAPTSEFPENIVTEKLPSARLPLVDNISETFDKLPPINLFRAAANAKTLYPAFNSVHVAAVQAVGAGRSD
jgi:hypothetical protein